jgi:transcriptional regulator with XRE-family HTH domain
MAEGDGDWRAMLRRERHRLGLTQVDLGTAVGLSPETVRKCEAGARTPTREHLMAILGALQVPQLEARAGGHQGRPRSGMPPTVRCS